MISFNKLFKTYLGKDEVYNFINSMIEESNYCDKVTKKHFYKELVTTQKYNKYFKKSIKC